LRSLPPLLRDEPALTALVGATHAVVSVPESARAFVIAGLAHLSARAPILVVTPTGVEAERLAQDLGVWLGREQVESFPAWETLPFERVSPSVETMGRRLRVLWHLRGATAPERGDTAPERGDTGPERGATGPERGDTGPERGDTGPERGGARSAPRVIVAPVRALLQRLGPTGPAPAPVVVCPGDLLDAEELVARLVGMGYRREYQVEHRGEVAVRGGIVDVFGSVGDLPVRIDLFGDEVDRLTSFDPGDQRSVEALSRVEIFGCRELVSTPEVRERAKALFATEPWGRASWERLAEGLVFDGMESWLPWLTAEEQVLPDLLTKGAQVIVVEPDRMRNRAAELVEEEAALAQTLAQTWGARPHGVSGHEGFPALHLDFERMLARTEAPELAMLSAPESPRTPTITASGWDPAAHGLVKQLADMAAGGWRVTVCAEGTGSAARLAETLELSVPVVADPAPGELAAPGVRVVVASLERGFVLPGLRLAVLAEADVTGRRRTHRRPRARTRASEGFFDDLAPGSYVVHVTHGVARYAGMVRRALGGAERDYLLLEYRGGDRLYVPSDQIDAVTPYTGGESPSLHRMGGSDWNRAKAKVRSAAREIAVELVDLYRRRQVTPGHCSGPDTPWQVEMEDAFAYVETPDQASAITAVKADMEAPVPMDRLVCGDVGFGKTEVAVRAAFKAVQDGRQAAVLVPTTLLAAQHFQTFSERYAGYPLRVEVLSRFLTPAQAREVLAGLASGAVDVVIGTHRLLSGDVVFKSLGLLVVDEEQRFGVSHKEAIKAISVGVDVLTLTATPIPRTLEMSLTGIRDLSLLNTPPADRQPILTYVGVYDERAVSEALRRELLREGQVFFVHNRVADIGAVAARLRALVPEARIAVAHGQMDEGTLEKVVLDFWEGAYDVLVCTTIIESGIDMPTVNTMVVDRADRLGLGQLHQLRGRVGRAGTRAYAYLFYPPERSLSEQAYERLRTIGEHTELGSGFKIAMRDLEIRGAGNLLGGDQSGHIAAVGYDLYVRMVSEAVAELKGSPVPAPAEVSLELGVDANLPPDYVERDDLRLEAYRRLATASSLAEVDDIGAEWADRFGPPPPSALALLDVARLRAECLRTGVREVTVIGVSGSAGGSSVRGSGVLARLAPLTLRASAEVRLRRLHPGATYTDGKVVVPLKGGSSAAAVLVDLLGELLPDMLSSIPSASTVAVAPTSS
jgi:transcription-repair coupling factor (superfamily II helicase)